MPRSVPLSCPALLVAVPAWAVQQPPAASLYHQQDSRSISIHNLVQRFHGTTRITLASYHAGTVIL